MPTRPLHPACPGWPVDRSGDESGRRLRRIVALSVLAHGLALGLKFQFWPKFAIDRAPKEVPLGYGTQPISVRLAPPRQPSEATPEAPPEHRLSATAGQPSRSPARPAAQLEKAATVPEPTAPHIDAQTMIARAKADIAAESRRQMLDSMFAPAARQPTAASPLERAVAPRMQTVEQLAGQRLRVTTADGRRYCLQSLPEAATRDIPTPVIAVPTNCP